MSITKNILFISHFYYPHKGGVEKHVQQLCSILKIDHNISIITSKSDKGLKDVEVISGVSVHRILVPKVKYFGLLSLWFKQLKYLNLFLFADVIHVHDVFIWVLPFRVIFFWKKMFITFHGWEGIYPIPLYKKLIKQASSFLSDGNICVGKYLQRIYKIKKDLVIYGGVVPYKVTYKKNKYKVVFVGRLTEDTGVDFFIQSLKKLKIPKSKVIFCGDGDFRRRCSNYGTVLGFVKNIDKYLTQSEICIAGGYLSTLESLNFGCVTVVIAQNKIRETIFELTPFKKWIYIAKEEKDLTEFLGHSNNNKFRGSSSIAKKWVDSQTWLYISSVYLKLWNRN